MYVDRVSCDILSVTRHNPVSHQLVIMVARTAFSRPENDATGNVPPLVVSGKNKQICNIMKIFYF